MTSPTNLAIPDIPATRLGPLRDAYDPKTPTARRIDELESVMATRPQAHCPVVHRWLPEDPRDGPPTMYIRQVFNPAGSAIATKIHKQEHVFTISVGALMIRTGEGEWTERRAPYTGVTKPGTRRIIYAVEDTVFTTYHPLDGLGITERDPDAVEAAIIQAHDHAQPQPILPAAEHDALLKALTEAAMPTLPEIVLAVHQARHEGGGLEAVPLRAHIDRILEALRAAEGMRYDLGQLLRTYTLSAPGSVQDYDQAWHGAKGAV